MSVSLAPPESETDTSWKVLIVDDEEDIHSVTRLALKRLKFKDRGLDIMSAYSGEQARETLTKNPDIALVLLDVVMETKDAGLRLAQDIRRNMGYEKLRIILRTGQPGEAPEESVILDYDIFDYKAKTDLTRQKLITTIISALRSYDEIRAIETRRRELLEQEAANRARSAFLANMSHELRTPLNVILGFARLLDRLGQFEDNQAQWLDAITENAQALLEMINNILAMSKMEAGFMDVRAEAVDLHFAVRRVFKRVAPLSSSIEVALELDEASVPRYAIVDESKLSHAISNLVSNAIKYTDKGSVRLIVAQEGNPDSEGRVPVRFRIQDTGIGIPESELRNIFGTFVQASNRGAREGTGLGLAITKNYVELMGGELQVESTEGVGSVFQFTIPVQPTDEVVDHAADENRRMVSGLAPGTRTPRVLVVEHGREAAVLIKEQLSMVGFEVRTAENGEDVSARLNDWNPALVLLDARMPGTRGHDLVKELRETKSGGADGGLKIIGMAPSAFKEDLELMAKAGCDAVLKKPIALEELLVKIANLLNIDYIYETIKDEPKDAPHSGTVDLSDLPAAWRKKLHKAAEGADDHAVLDLIDKIEPKHPDAAAGLRQLVEDFDFKTIMKLSQ